MTQAAVDTESNDIPTRDDIEEAYKWDLSDIYPDWDAWEEDVERTRGLMDELVELKGTLSDGPQELLKAYELNDDIGRLAYKLYRYPQLSYDTDQRNNELQAKLQRVQQLFAEFGTKTAWFDPELLTIDEDTVIEWIDQTPELEQYRFPISEIYRQREHRLDEEGEKLLSYGSRFNSMPRETYRALSTADIEFNTIELSDGQTVTVSHAEYGKLLRTRREREDRRKAFEALYEVYGEKRNTYASLYNGVCQRDHALAQARSFDSTAEAALDSNNVPVSVLETLIETARDGVEPFQRYHRLRADVLGLEGEYDLYDSSLPLVEATEEYPYDEVTDSIIQSVTPLGTAYQSRVSEALNNRWIDVYETKGKRSGAYSAGVYGVHPYMLLNYNDTLRNVFTLAHELGHTMHTLLANEAQPFATSSYTIFVAEVASTLNEALLLDHMLGQTDDPKERAVLLQHQIDAITGTFYSQAMFANFELEAHRLVESGQPITADTLSGLYRSILETFYGDTAELDELYDVTWSRIPHFFNSPYYVYQYATCYASSAKLVEDILGTQGEEHEQAVERYLDLLRAGGSDHPMNLLQDAGVDLRESATVRAVVDQLDGLVDMLEEEIARCH
ncbi:MAG: oligoendopeptidase F [Myxococcota bacterium]